MSFLRLNSQCHQASMGAVFVEVSVCKAQSVCVNPGEENREETGHWKVTGDCRQNNIVVKGNKNKAGIGSSFHHSQGECKAGPMELPGG